MFAGNGHQGRKPLEPIPGHRLATLLLAADAAHFRPDQAPVATKGDEPTVPTGSEPLPGHPFSRLGVLPPMIGPTRFAQKVPAIADPANLLKASVFAGHDLVSLSLHVTIL